VERLKLQVERMMGELGRAHNNERKDTFKIFIVFSQVGAIRRL
jgi:hypothetical protein